MRDRLIALALVLGVVAGAVGVGVLAVAGSGDDEPRPLPVLGTSAQPAAAGAETDAALVRPGSVTVEVDRDLPALDGEAAAWRVDRAVDEARIRDLAAALGVDGDVTDTELGWAVDDGAHRLDVQRQAGLPWWYGPSPDAAVDGGAGSGGSSGSASGVAEPDPGCDPGTDCAATTLAVPAPDCPPEEGCPTATTIVEPVPDCPPEQGCQPPSTEECLAAGTCIADPPPDSPDSPDSTVVCDMPACPPDGACVQVCPEEEPPEPPADKPSQDDARAQATPILEATGVDLGAAAVRLDDTFTGWAVTVDPVVGGLPTVGMSSSVTVGPDGVEYAGGWLSTPAEGDTYPLIGTAAALERFEEQGAGGPMPLTAADATEPMICQDDGSGGCLPPEPVTIRITGARLALQLMPTYGTDDGWLVPAYLFEVDAGGPTSEIPVLAVADEYLTEPPAPEDPAVPPGCELVGGDAVACPEPGATEPGATEPAPPVGEEEVGPLPDGERAEVGVGYYLDVYTHCGVREVEFDGRWWDADPVLDATDWARPTEGGTITLLSPDEAEFVGDAARTKVAHFVARAPGAPAPEPCR